MNKAATEMLVELAISNSKGKEINVHHEAMSQIHKARSRKILVSFDMDGKDLENDMESIGWQQVIYNIVGNLDFKLLETRGGYHIILEPKNVEPSHRSTWHSRILSLPNIDISRDKDGKIVENMTPIPGTYQGGFTPKFV